MTDRVDLDAAVHALYMASREVASIPYTAPEVLSARMRQVVPLAQDLSAELAVLRAQRDAALAVLDAAVAEQDRAATEATAQDADSPAAASARGRAGGVYLAAELVRAALGVQPEPDDG